MDFPLTLQMEIDISAAAHKREVADGFAKLRAELLPESKPDPLRAMMASMQNAVDERHASRYWSNLQAAGLNQCMNPFLGSACAAQTGGLYGFGAWL